MLEPVAVWAAIGDIITQEMKDEEEEIQHEILMLELEQAKTQGLDAVRDFLENNHSLSDRGFGYVNNVPQETLNKLLSGEILTSTELTRSQFNEFSDYQHNLNGNLYFIVMIPYNPEGGSYMIDSIFIQDEPDPS